MPEDRTEPELLETEGGFDLDDEEHEHKERPSPAELLGDNEYLDEEEERAEPPVNDIMQQDPSALRELIREVANPKLPSAEDDPRMKDEWIVPTPFPSFGNYDKRTARILLLQWRRSHVRRNMWRRSKEMTSASDRADGQLDMAMLIHITKGMDHDERKLLVTSISGSQSFDKDLEAGPRGWRDRLRGG